MAKDPTTSAASADESTQAPSPPSDAPTPADTGDEVLALATKYDQFSWNDLMAISSSDETGAIDRFCSDVRRMAMSLIRQNER